MKLQALVLSIVLLFGAAAFAQSAPKQTPPDEPTQNGTATPDVKAPLNIVDRTKDPIGQAFAAEVNAYFTSIDGVEITKGVSSKDDTTRPEIRVMSKQLGDNQTFVIVSIALHIQGKNLPLYIGTFATTITSENAKAEGDSASEAIGGALESIEGYVVEDYPNAFGTQQQEQQQSTPAPSTCDNTVQI